MPPTPRLAPLDEAERSDDQRQLLGGLGLGATNIFATLARAPGLFRKWLPFGGRLLVGKLPARERELLILRTAFNCRAGYEWGHHVAIGLQSGLTRHEIDRIPGGPEAGWAPPDAVLLRAADELHARYGLSDDTWAALAARFDDAQLIELPMVVGHYTLLAMTLNSLGVELEPGFEALPS